MVEHPAGEHGFRCFLDPLIDEGGDFVSEIGGVVESSQFKTLQGRSGCGLQIVERWRESRHCHDLGSN